MVNDDVIVETIDGALRSNNEEITERDHVMVRNIQEMIERNGIQDKPVWPMRSKYTNKRETMVCRQQ